MLKRLKLLIIMTLLVGSYLPGFTKLQELRQRLIETEAEIKTAKRKNRLLEEKIANMRNNQDYLEIVARDKLGVVKKGETVFKIVREEEAVITEDSI